MSTAFRPLRPRTPTSIHCKKKKEMRRISNNQLPYYIICTYVITNLHIFIFTVFNFHFSHYERRQRMNLHGLEDRKKKLEIL